MNGGPKETLNDPPCSVTPTGNSGKPASTSRAMNDPTPFGGSPSLPGVSPPFGASPTMPPFCANRRASRRVRSTAATRACTWWVAGGMVTKPYNRATRAKAQRVRGVSIVLCHVPGGQVHAAVITQCISGSESGLRREATADAMAKVSHQVPKPGQL